MFILSECSCDDECVDVGLVLGDDRCFVQGRRAGPADAPSDSVEGGCTPQQFTVTQNPDGSWLVTFNAGCTFLEGHAVSKCAHTLCEPALPNAEDTGALFVPCEDPSPPPDDHDISHIEFVYCCETTE